MKQKIYFQKLMKGRFEFVFPTAQEKLQKMNKIKKLLLNSYLNNYFDEILAVMEALEYQLKHNMLKVNIKDTGKNRLKRYLMRNSIVCT